MSGHEAAGPLDWHRFSGAFANAVPPQGYDCEPTIGMAWHRCDCCGRDFLMVAAIAPDGAEVNVALPALQAVGFLSKAAALVASMGSGCVKETQQ